MHTLWLQEILLLQGQIILQNLHLKVVYHLENLKQINDTFIDETEHINIAMSMYKLIEYSDNYSDTLGSLWRFKRDETEGNVDLTVNAQHILNNSSSFKCKSSLSTNRNDIKIAVPLKHLRNF